jgi:hypothetical protein
MEMSQGNSLCSNLKQIKMLLLLLFFYKIGEQKAGTGPSWGGRRRGERV